MATTALDGTPCRTSGELPAIGSAAPPWTVTDSRLSDVTQERYAGHRVVLNIFPSVETGVCAAAMRRFNEIAGGLDATVVLCVSKDLPFTQARFCGAEGLDAVEVGSAFRTDFGEMYGVTLLDGAFAALLARAVVVVDTDGTVRHAELVPDIGQEPDYDAALDVLR